MPLTFRFLRENDAERPKSEIAPNNAETQDEKKVVSLQSLKLKVSHDGSSSDNSTGLEDSNGDLDDCTSSVYSDDSMCFKDFSEYGRVAESTDCSVGDVEDLFVPLSQVDISEELLGQGSFGEVRQGVLFGSTDVAIKTPHQTVPLPFEELAILSNLHHPNLVIFYGIASIDDKQCLITEFINGGNLNDYVLSRRATGAFAQECAIANQEHNHLLAEQKLLQDVARGMVYLHRQKPAILHTCLKPSNILVDDYDPAQARISDIGMGKFFSQDNQRVASGGFDVASDVFAFGGVALFVLSGAQSVDTTQDCKVLDCMSRICSRDMACLGGVASVAVDCLREDPTSRPPFSSIYTDLSAVRCSPVEECAATSQCRVSRCSDQLVNGKPQWMAGYSLSAATFEL